MCETRPANRQTPGDRPRNTRITTVERPPSPPEPSRERSWSCGSLKEEQPDLGSAVDLQIELLQLQRRVQSRVPLPSMSLDAEHLDGRARRGQADPHLRPGADRLERPAVSRALDRGRDAHARGDRRRGLPPRRMLTRDAERLAPCVRDWYDAARPRPRAAATSRPSRRAGAADPAGDAAVPVALRRRDHGAHDLRGWSQRHLPALRRRAGLLAHHAGGRAAADLLPLHDALALPPAHVPVLPERRSRRITSFATRDGLYRLNGCDVCQRYIKAFDGRHAPRPVMPAVDAIATLPLDAAAVQRGYR